MLISNHVKRIAPVLLIAVLTGAFLFGSPIGVDEAVKDSGYQKSSMTAAQLDQALDQACEKGVIGHYLFCLYADHNDILGFASSSYGSPGHRMWQDEDAAKYTFKEMDDYVTEYLDQTGY